MKRILILASIIIIMISCKGDMGPMGPQGEPGYGTNWYTKSFTIPSNKWKLMGAPTELNSFFYADFELPQLTNSVFDEGTVLGYLSTAKNIKNGLPYVVHQGEVENGKEYLWTQTYDFDFYPGGVRFYVTFSDFMTDFRPEDETFNIVLMW